MIKDNQKYFNRLHVLFDACVVAGSYLFAWFIKFKSGLMDNDAGRLSDETYISALIFIIPLFIAMYSLCNLYSSKRMSGRVHEFYNIVKANTIGLIIFIVCQTAYLSFFSPLIRT